MQPTRMALVTTLVLVSLVQAGCSSVEQLTKPSLDTSGLAASVEEVVGVPVTVTCPEEIPIESGRVTECAVSDGSNSKVLLVTQLDDQGKLDWEISAKDAPAQEQ